MSEVDEIRAYIAKAKAIIDEDIGHKEYSRLAQCANALYKAGVAIGSHGKIDECIDTLKEARKTVEFAIKQTKHKTPYRMDKACQAAGRKTPEIALWYLILKELAPHDFDSYMLYLEKNRPYDDRFYAPRRTCLIKIGVVQDLQDLEDDKLDILSISLPPGTGKTTLEKFFATWVIGRHPKDYSLFFSHSDDITRMFYDSILAITNTSDYCWPEIFPNCRIRKTDAARQQIDFGPQKTFWSIQCTSRFSSNSGKVRASCYLYVDDLIGRLEEAMNIGFLDKLFGIYAVDARQRKLNGKVKELHIATRWSVHDVIGRLQRIYEGNPRAKFLAVPDIDPDTGESNFLYEVDGMDVDFFHEQEKLMDEASYRALYKNEPIEREGLLYAEDNLRRFCELPQTPPDEILAQCDTKGKGIDYMVMPIFYRYGEDYYLVDCVCSNSSDYEVQYQSLAEILVLHKVQNCDFERNAGGDRVAMEVNKRVQAMGWVCNITDTPTETNKEARIYQCSGWIKNHILFKDKSEYVSKSDYGVFMSLLCSYTTAGKNAHDDVPDCIANFCLRMQKTKKIAKVEVVSNPFRAYYGGF